MTETKTKVTAVRVSDFIAAVENDVRRRDATTLVELMGRLTGWQAQMWGPTIIGFGRYHYVYETGHSGDSAAMGFSPRNGATVVYIAQEIPDRERMVAELGKVKTGKVCIYINSLAKIDIAALERLILASVASTRSRWPVADR